MRIAVTGAAGGIGRHVVAHVLAEGHSVSAVDRATPAGGVPDGDVTWHTGDVTDEQVMGGVVEGADALIHLAAIPSPLMATAREVFTTNSAATFVALESAGVAGVRRVAFASTGRWMFMSGFCRGSQVRFRQARGRYARLAYLSPASGLRRWESPADVPFAWFEDSGHCRAWAR